MYQITKADIQTANQHRQVWALGNKVLYDLCRKHPRHTNDAAIIAKVLLIGRVYAAAIERRLVVKEKGDDYYTKTVATKIKGSPIDRWLSALPRQLTTDEQTTAQILRTHRKVTNLFSNISEGLSKRSLASKYLHFHRPDLYFIFDKRAMSGIRLLTPALAQHEPDGFDPAYASFFRRCQGLTENIKEKLKIDLKPRQLDDILITISERRTK